MTNDLRAAAERVRRVDKGETPVRVYLPEVKGHWSRNVRRLCGVLGIPLKETT